MTSLGALHASEIKRDEFVEPDWLPEPPYDDPVFRVIFASSHRMVERIVAGKHDDFKVGDFGYVPDECQPLMAHDIIEIVAHEHGLTIGEIMGESRHTRIAWPRQMAMYLIKKSTHQSKAAIGRLFRKDHTTVMHAMRSVELRMKEKPEQKAALLRIMDRLDL